MSLTGSHHAFASIDENGVNDALVAFFGARPHYLHYGSPPFVTTSSTTATLMSPIPFPGTGGISWAVDLTVPSVDLYPPDGPLPPPLILGPDRLSLETSVTITLGCTTGDRRKGGVRPVHTTLDVIAIAGVTSIYISPGVGDLLFHVDEVLLPDVQPTSLQGVLDCLLEMVLTAVLASVTLPFNVIDADFFKIILEAGPEIADDQIKVWGDIS